MKADQVIPARDEGKEKAYKKRYNRDVKIYITRGITEAGQKWYSLYFNSKKGTEFVITEFFTKDLDTDYVTLSYKHGDRTITNKFSRFLDAEISVCDFVAMEEEDAKGL